MNEQTLTLDVQGVTCAGCVSTLTRVLGALPGVRQVTVDQATGRTQVRLDAEQVERAAVVAAIEDAGYDVG